MSQYFLIRLSEISNRLYCISDSTCTWYPHLLTPQRYNVSNPRSRTRSLLQAFRLYQTLPYGCSIWGIWRWDGETRRRSDSERGDQREGRSEERGELGLSLSPFSVFLLVGVSDKLPYLRFWKRTSWTSDQRLSRVRCKLRATSRRQTGNSYWGCGCEKFHIPTRLNLLY